MEHDTGSSQSSGSLSEEEMEEVLEELRIAEH